MKELFTVPEGGKVTEKAFAKVLFSSVCSILLCMACLVSTTWAWFSASVENEGNVIEIATAPKVILTVGGQVFPSGAELKEGTHKVFITHGGDKDDFHRKSILYVTLTIDGKNSVYTVLNSGNDYCEEVEISVGKGSVCVLSYKATWFEPANANLLTGNTINIAEKEAASAEETTAA